eukprot:130567-Chlamydomonas_euryale.AAC.1
MCTHSHANSAGPEDLVASEKMLRRVTANPGEYNDAFVNEFKVFVRELRDFFNASGLEDVIAKTTDTLDAPHAAAVEQLLSSKRKVEGGGASGSLDDLMALLFAVTQACMHPSCASQTDEGGMSRQGRDVHLRHAADCHPK